MGVGSSNQRRVTFTGNTYNPSDMKKLNYKLNKAVFKDLEGGRLNKTILGHYLDRVAGSYIDGDFDNEKVYKHCFHYVRENIRLTDFTPFFLKKFEYSQNSLETTYVEVLVQIVNTKVALLEKISNNISKKAMSDALGDLVEN